MLKYHLYTRSLIGWHEDDATVLYVLGIHPGRDDLIAQVKYEHVYDVALGESEHSGGATQVRDSTGTILAAFTHGVAVPVKQNSTE